MRIIKSGKRKLPKSATTTCDCGCKFSFTADEARFVSDPRYGDAYVAKCPECKNENWVGSAFFL
jgi:hypothetical protein